MREMIELEEALEIVLNRGPSASFEQVDLLDSLDRVLAEDIYSEMNVPPFDRSPLDGYAVRARDTVGASLTSPIILKILEEVPAGYMATQELGLMTAIKILTGAPIPTGADAVIRFEDTKANGDSVSILTPLKPLDGICKAGEDIKKGELVLSRGKRICPTAIGLLASLGKSRVPVLARPKVAILSTGDELVDVTETLKPGQIRNSNLYMLAAAVKDLGCEPIILGIVRDRLEETKEAINRGLMEADLVISTGGVSLGDYDVVKDAILHCSAQILFWKVAVKPGTPVVVGEREGKLIFGLSGNPAGASIVFEILVKPLLRKLTGKEHFLPSQAVAILGDQFLKKSGMRRFLRGRVDKQGDEFKVTLTGQQTPGVLKSFLECNALIDIPAGSEALTSGNHVKILFVDANKHQHQVN